MGTEKIFTKERWSTVIEIHHAHDTTNCDTLKALAKELGLILFELVGMSVAMVCFCFSIIGPPIFILQDVHGIAGPVITIFYGFLQIGEMMEIDRIYQRKAQANAKNRGAHVVNDVFKIGTSASVQELLAVDADSDDEGVSDG